MYKVEKMVDGQRVEIGKYCDIDLASRAIDLDMRINGADIVYYVEREGSYEPEQTNT